MKTIDMEKKIKDYAEEASDKDLELAKEFLKFQEKTIDIFKEYL